MERTSRIETQDQHLNRLYHCVKCRSDQDTILITENGNTVIIRCDACQSKWTVTVLD